MSSKMAFWYSILDQLLRRFVDIFRIPIKISRTLLREDDSQSSKNRMIIGYKDIGLLIYEKDEEN